MAEAAVSTDLSGRILGPVVECAGKPADRDPCRYCRDCGRCLTCEPGRITGSGELREHVCPGWIRRWA